MTNQENKGRSLLQCMFTLGIIMEIFIINRSVAKYGYTDLASGATRLLLTLGLMKAFMDGKRWAKRLYIILSLLAVIVFGFVLLRSPELLILIGFVYFLILVCILLFSKSVKVYLDRQRSSH
jgi:hypothetical protein